MSSVGVPKFGLKDCIGRVWFENISFQIYRFCFFFSSSSVRKFEARFESGLNGLELADKVQSWFD